jgi:hyperosmotically inducible periplasmic protein
MRKSGASMKTLISSVTFSILVLVSFTGCSTEPKSSSVASNVRGSLNQPAFKNVSVSQDRENGVVTLAGHVATDAEKAEAALLARANAAGQVVSDEIAVLPPGNENAAKTVAADLDKAIEKNLDAVKALNRLDENVKYAVKNGVVTLTGSVDSQSARAQAQQVAGTVPNVQQVVNELQVRHQKATSDRP